MSAAPQLRAQESDLSRPAVAPAPADPPAENPIQLLRAALERLKSSNDLPDQAQVADLLSEAKEALEHANLVAHAVARCEAFLKEHQFRHAFEVLDAGLLAYPTDAVLLAHRQAAEKQQKAFQAAADVRAAIKEAQWLLDQDRIDLALRFLQGKAEELPNQPELVAGLQELEALLPQWDSKRQVQAALGRAATLEQLQQGEAALTVLEEALQAYPESLELKDAAQRARDRVGDQERRKRLARRVELIGQKIAAQSWREALALLKDTIAESPGLPELSRLQSEANAGLRRAECEAVAAQVRQFLADGELEDAEKALRRGRKSWGDDLALLELTGELESARKHREELRAAQVLFARRKLKEAELALERLVSPDRPEAQALLQAVRQARAATEEEDFCERGRKQAQALMQQEQFPQAIDLLRNLISLFPGNPQLPEDLRAAERGLEKTAPTPPVPVPAVAVAAPVAVPPAPKTALPPAPKIALPPTTVTAPVLATRHRWRAAAVGTATFLLAAGAGAAWNFARRTAPSPQPVEHIAHLPLAAQAAPAPPPPAADATPVAPQTSAAPPPSEASEIRKSAAQSRPPATVAKAFVPPKQRQIVPPQNAPLPAAPASGAVPSAATAAAPPAVAQFVGTPLPVRVAPPPAAGAPASASAPSKATAPAASGGKFEEAQILQRSEPVYPSLARQLRLFGMVRLEVHIDEHGQVQSLKVLNGHPVLAAAARDSLRNWKFKPAVLDGQPIASNMVVQISFGNGNK